MKTTNPDDQEKSFGNRCFREYKHQVGKPDELLRAANRFVDELDLHELAEELRLQVRLNSPRDWINISVVESWLGAKLRLNTPEQFYLQDSFFLSFDRPKHKFSKSSIFTTVGFQDELIKHAQKRLCPFFRINRHGKAVKLLNDTTIAKRHLALLHFKRMTATLFAIANDIRSLPKSSQLLELHNGYLSETDLNTLDFSTQPIDDIVTKYVSQSKTTISLFCRKEPPSTDVDVKENIQQLFKPVIEDAVSEKRAAESAALKSLNLKCIDFDIITRTISLAPYFPTAEARDARASGVQSNEQSEDQFFQDCLTAVAQEDDVNFDSDRRLIDGTLTDETVKNFLSNLNAWIRQERLAEAQLLEAGLLHILPNRCWESSSHAISIEQQLRAVICGDVKVIQGQARWKACNSRSSSDKDCQLELLTRYRLYLAASLNVVSQRVGAASAKAFLFKVLSATFSHEPSASEKCFELVAYCNELSDSPPASLHIDEPDEISPNPFLKFAEQETLREKQIEELLERLPDDDLKTEIMETAKEARINRWNQLQDAISSDSLSQHNGDALAEIKRLMKGQDG